MRVAAVLVAFWAFGTAQGWAANPKSVPIPASVEVYAQAIRTDSTAEVEKLYRLGLRTAEDLLSTVRTDTIGQYHVDLDVLEGLSDADYQTASEKMLGFGLTREETVGAYEDLDFFAQLSRRHQDKVSLEFFETVRQTMRASFSVWPTYLEQQTDYGGCTKFGSIELVRCYRLLTRFRSLHPQRYADRIKDLIDPLEYELTDGMCACGVISDMATEFRAFLKEFPEAAIASKVRTRLRDIESGKLTMKDHCISG